MSGSFLILAGCLVDEKAATTQKGCQAKWGALYGSQVRVGADSGHLKSNQVYRLLAFCLWVVTLPSPSLGFLSRKTGLIIVFTPRDVVGLRGSVDWAVLPPSVVQRGVRGEGDT